MGWPDERPVFPQRGGFLNSNRRDSPTVNSEIAGDPPTSKYHSVAKAAEYAAMSWRHLEPNSTATAFYDGLVGLTRDMSAAACGTWPLLMEVGFGAGRFLYEMCEANSRAVVVGVEQSESMAEMARSVLAEVSPSAAQRVRLHSGDVQNLPGFGQAADFVLCVNVLDRIERTSAGIANLARATRDGGTLLVVTALDYESTFTPSHEQLSSEQMIGEFDAAGCALERSLWTQLHKVTKPGHGRVFDELVLILRKRG